MNKDEAALKVVPPDWVMMVHPDLEDSYTLVHQAAYEEVHQDQGWQVANFSEAETEAATTAAVQGDTSEQPQQKEE